MDILPLILFILLIIFDLPVHGLQMTHLRNEKIDVKRRLELLNKPAKKSFQTKHGDIVDCVEINKQLAFDHPLLKNHSIQMKPSFINNKTSEGPISLFLPKNMRCPKGTVLIKRILEGDLAMEKFTPILLGTSNSIYSNDGYQVASLVGLTKHTGVSANVNVFYPEPEVKPGQFSSVSVAAGSEDGNDLNAIKAGWMVNPSLFPSSTRLFSYWTKDSGKTTGCYNTLCPGFVQISHKISLGLELPVSKIAGDRQVFVDVELQQDIQTKNWWLKFQGENIGYWPKELFNTLANGATRAGWGGEIYSKVGEPGPGMGAGYQSDAAYSRACLLRRLQVINPQLFPESENLRYAMTDSKNYNVALDKYGEWEHFIYVGGPRKL